MSGVVSPAAVAGADPWGWFDSGIGEPAFNMALDEALLESAAMAGRPVLRFYGWTVPAATFGYFQRHSEIEPLTALRPLVRRPTGGGLVPHDEDWTYSLVFPAGHPWHALRARESYRAVHEWLRLAFLRLGETAVLAPAARRDLPGQCFVGWEESDLLWHGRKIAGAAQRRTRDGLLIQGSVQPPRADLSRAAWQQAMIEVNAPGLASAWEPWLRAGAVSARARELADQKYLRPEFNERKGRSGR